VHSDERDYSQQDYWVQDPLFPTSYSYDNVVTAERPPKAPAPHREDTAARLSKLIETTFQQIMDRIDALEESLQDRA